ncbi:IS630 transposase-related protein [Clostridium sp.]|uniref:IS630 transposase-related protein n=1 Tax=Clostridium sp. TaxID=1506 RepID=UPI002631D3CD|nr:IS630 transposase-related protein [Clostridium sp.]
MSNEVITEQQEKMISLLIKGTAITDISKQLHCSRQAIYDWLKRDDVKANLDRRRQDLINQGNQLIMKDLASYIDNIKELADDKSDKRVCLAANQYLINRIYGNPTSVIETNSDNLDENSNVNELELEITKFRGLLKNKKG